MRLLESIKLWIFYTYCFYYKLSLFIAPVCDTQHQTDSCSATIRDHACLRLVRRGLRERGGATEAANAKASQQINMTGTSQSSPFLLARISQSEDAALET